jgi:C4-dicarboxylate transporter DctQ subunit
MTDGSFPIMKINRAIFEFEKWFAIILLAIMFILTFSQFVARYFFNTGYAWLPEMVVFACFNLALVATSTGVKNRVHIGVDVVIMLLPQKLQYYASIFANSCGLVLFLFMFFATGKFVLFFKNSGLLSITTEVPLWVFVAYMPFAFLFMALHYMEILWGEFSERNEKGEKQSKVDSA